MKNKWINKRNMLRYGKLLVASAVMTVTSSCNVFGSSPLSPTVDFEAGSPTLDEAIKRDEANKKRLMQRLGQDSSPTANQAQESH